MFWVVVLFASISMDGSWGSDILRLKSSTENTQAVSFVFNLEMKIFKVPTWPSNCSKALFSKALRKGLSRDPSSGYEDRQLKISSYFLLRNSNRCAKVEYLPPS